MSIRVWAVCILLIAAIAIIGVCTHGERHKPSADSPAAGMAHKAIDESESQLETGNFTVRPIPEHPTPPPSTPAAVYSSIVKPAHEAWIERIKSRRILADLPDYCAYLVEPIDNSTVRSMTEGANALKGGFPSADGIATQAEAILRKRDQWNVYALVEVTLDKDGFASWCVTSSTRPLATEAHPSGRLTVNWIDESQKASAQTVASLFSAYFEQGWGIGMPEKIRESMKQAEQRIERQ